MWIRNAIGTCLPCATLPLDDCVRLGVNLEASQVRVPYVILCLRRSGRGVTGQYVHAGSFNAKRAYFGTALAERLGIRGWRSETHVIAGLWSAEVLHSLRLRTETFRAICPDDPSAFEGWWSGKPPTSGKTSTLVVLDPFASDRERVFVALDEALKLRPRHAGYAEAARLSQAA